MNILRKLATAFFVMALATAVHAESVKVFAAASLKTSLDEIARVYANQGGGTFVGVYAGTPALAKQIIEGAPADIFISADTKWMDEVAARKLIDEKSRKNLLGNELVVVAPAGAAALTDIKALDALVGAGKLSVADVKSVPAGRYAKEALEKLELWPALEPKLVQSENVRIALTYVAKGEAAAGIVYRSDAISEKSVTVVARLAPETHTPIIYPVALVTASKNPDRAKVLAFLSSEAAQKIFRANGFDVLP